MGDGNRNYLVTQVIISYCVCKRELLFIGKIASNYLFKETINLWPIGGICYQISLSTLVQAMACCLMAPSHYMNWCWFLYLRLGGHFSIKRQSYPYIHFYDKNESYLYKGNPYTWKDGLHIATRALWHWSDSNFTRNAQESSHWNMF